jgi:cbb3-type cytochrome oxidase cytochrome c subunit
MKGLAPLFLGIFGTFAFSWVGLIVIPNWQIGDLNPQADEEGTDIYPMPQSGMVERGARVFAANGCIYCHSQQVRADYAADDIERKWGDRRSAPRDYVFERPVFLGKMRMGQDLANIGARAPAEQESPAPTGAAAPATSPGASPSPSSAQGAASRASSPGSPTPKPPATPASPSPTAAAAAASPAASPSPTAAPWPMQASGEPAMYSAAWHHVHLYSPRTINIDSNMPAYRFLYEKRRIVGERSDDALDLTGSDAPPEGWEIVPTDDAKCLVAYLMSLNQSHPLKEVRSTGPAAAGSPAASPAPGGQPAK